MKDDSRKIEVGDTYISLTNNINYIEDAIKNGAKKVIVENGLYSVDTLIVNNTREYLINYLDNLYKDKFSKIKLIGITGTNGKTTSSYLLWQILNKLGIKCGYIGTIGFYIEGKVTDLNNTTPDILDIYNMINQCIDEGCKYVVMEVSSQALSYNRVGNLLYNYGIFTNLTKDHLDYHKDMHHYALAKQLLFKRIKDKAIVNYDDINKHYFLLDNTNITYGFTGGDYHITDYNITKDYSTFILNDIEYKTNLIGKYNIYNLLISLIILKEEKINFNKDIFETLEYPKGRMEVVNYNDNKIIVDYAHTPDAMINIINATRELQPSKIITIIGCGGNRDKTKRSEMGNIATSLSDYVIFTNDNPRGENPNDIMNDIVQKLDTTNYKIELNREKAIIMDIQMLDKYTLSIMIRFILSAIFGYILIPQLKKFHAKQNISIFLKKEHKDKQVIPTIGGLIFIIPTIVTIIILILTNKISYTTNLLIVLVTFLLYGVLGFIDDYLSIKRGNNVGLSELQKLIGQFIIALLFFYLFVKAGNKPDLDITFFNFNLHLGWTYGFFVLLVLIATTNAVNLTDGLDGLAGGLSAIAFLAFGLISWGSLGIAGYESIAVFCFVLVGCLLGFLLYNTHPAKVIMCDTGSLALGGALAAVAIITRHEFTLIIVAGVFVIETLSAIIQRIAGRYWGKKVFLMAPLHHHFEKLGWAETDIVKLFWTVGLILSMAAITYGVWM